MSLGGTNNPAHLLSHIDEEDLAEVLEQVYGYAHHSKQLSSVVPPYKLADRRNLVEGILVDSS